MLLIMSPAAGDKNLPNVETGSFSSQNYLRPLGDLTFGLLFSLKTMLMASWFCLLLCLIVCLFVCFFLFACVFACPFNIWRCYVRECMIYIKFCLFVCLFV